MKPPDLEKIALQPLPGDERQIRHHGLLYLPSPTSFQVGA
jgi:hypothetical protein